MLHIWLRGVIYDKSRIFPLYWDQGEMPAQSGVGVQTEGGAAMIGREALLEQYEEALFALLMAVSMFLYSKMTSSQMSDDPNMAPMKFMSVWLMPIMMLFICNNLSSALSYYYLLSNLITMLMTWVIKKFVVTEDKVRAEIVANENKPKKKSKWQQRLEEAQKMQEQMMKERQKGRR